MLAQHGATVLLHGRNAPRARGVFIAELEALGAGARRRAARSRARARSGVSGAASRRSRSATDGSTACCTTRACSAIAARSSTTTSACGSACCSSISRRRSSLRAACCRCCGARPTHRCCSRRAASATSAARYWGAYAVSKFGTEGLAQVLADELENTPIRVNAINPGATRTRMRAQRLSGRESCDVARARPRRSHCRTCICSARQAAACAGSGSTRSRLP